MGIRVAPLMLALLGSAPLCRAQVPAQATVLALRGARAAGAETSVAFEVRDGRGQHVPGVATADVTARVGKGPLGVGRLLIPAPTGIVWVLDATRRARIERFSEMQQAFALWADSLRRGGEIVAVVAAGQPPQLVQTWTSERTPLRAAVDNLGPRADEADLSATLRLASETCRTMPAPAVRCAVVFVTDARDAIAAVARLDSSAAMLAGLGVPIYAARLGPDPGEGASSDALARLIQASGGVLVADVEAGSALRRLRARLAEGYVAFLSGMPTGRAVQLALSVRTADGRTLRDSASVRLEAPAVRPDSSRAVRPAAQEKGRSWKLWLGLLSLLVAGGAAWLFFGRRKAHHDEADSLPVSPATPPFPPADVPIGPSGAAQAVSASAGSPPVAVADGTPPLRLTLRPLLPDAPALTINVGDRITLGRSASQADTVVPGDPAISACHVALERHGKNVLLRDLGSTNGTAVNGVPVQGTVVLNDGDVLRLGETDLRVHYSKP